MQRWERSGEGAWASLEEDADGRLVDGAGEAEERARKRYRREAQAGGVARGLIRYVAVVVDGSEAAGQGDLRPSRLGAACGSLSEFLVDLFAGNPFSRAGVICARDGSAEVVSQLSSAGRAHAEALRRVAKRPPKGPFSLQRALERVLEVLEGAPDYGFREAVLVLSSLATQDAGDLNAVATRLSGASVRCHVVNVAAETYVVKKLCSATGGTFGVALDRRHLAALLAARVPPPAVDATDDRLTRRDAPPLVEMGFPKLRVEAAAVPAAGPQVGAPPVWTTTTYTCPRCATRAAHLPGPCAVCDLPLVSAPHLAQSYHHLFPVPPFVEEAAKSETPNEACFACRAPLAAPAGADAAAPPRPRFRCPACESAFCADCDEFIHASLHNCPGCCVSEKAA